jgi:hypothetical protein
MNKLENLPYADLKREYLKDWLEISKPWERWQFRNIGSSWGHSQCSGHPSWSESLEYRHIPTPPKTININDFEVPEPVRKELEINQTYWYADPYSRDSGHDHIWRGDDIDRRLLQYGLIHLTKEAAMIHRKALISFTSHPDD